MTEHHDRSAGSAQEHMQSRGRHYDIIREALATYDEWMLDDDYNPGVTLKTIIDRMRERVEMTDASGVTFNVAQPTRSDLSSDQIMEILRRTVQGELLGLLTIGRRRNDGSDARIPSMSAEVLAREFRAASQPSPAATVEREQIEWWEGQMQLAMAEIERLRVESLERQEQVCETNDRLMAAQDQAHLSAGTAGEPVAWRWNTIGDQAWRVTISRPVPTNLTAFDKIEPLYATQPQPACTCSCYAEGHDASCPLSRPWQNCPSTHCERAGECRSPSDCCAVKRPDLRSGK